MRKVSILIFLFSVLALPLNSEAALSASIIWECRASATGSMVNGGGFKTGATGTDYSQQDAAAFNGTDLACADGDAAAPAVTSATHNFVAADVGNVIHITAGTSWTAGWYEIVSCSGNAATMDRAVGANGALTNGTWYEGGALSLNSTLDDDFFEQVVDGNIVYIQDGNYTLGESISIAAVNAGTAPAFIIGYKTTRGDDPSGADRPNLTAGAAERILGFTGASSNWIVKNLIVSSDYTGSYGVIYGQGTENVFINCKATNTTATANKNALYGSANGTYFINCEGTAAVGRGAQIEGGVTLYGCYLHDSNGGVYISGIGFVINSIIDTCASYGITVGTVATATLVVINSTLYGANDADAYAIGSSTGVSPQLVINCIIQDWAYGLSHDVGNSTMVVYNSIFYSNGADNNNTAIIGSGNYLGTSLNPGLTDPANGDFRPSNVVRGIGARWPNTSTGIAAGESFMDIGAFQNQDGAILYDSTIYDATIY